MVPKTNSITNFIILKNTHLTLLKKTKPKPGQTYLYEGLMIIDDVEVCDML